MNQLKGLPQSLEEQVKLVEKTLGLLKLQKKEDTDYAKSLEMKLNIINWVLHHRDEQVREALNWYTCYKENHVKLMYDYPTYAKEIENMQKVDYHEWLLKKAFEGLYEK